eukprot:TRINITY_DN1510_c0_g1_i1.p1 TRINITY_DN1510_c0_g1~~TRINITY_DN1510_c0_g1_i1.p1  ORF type:complete len:200 (+),score=36.72 TRINITY_DN1510_c0_g1_i1:73-672(+)
MSSTSYSDDMCDAASSSTPSSADCASGSSAPSQTRRLVDELRLPELRPLPLLNEEQLLLVSQMKGGRPSQEERTSKRLKPTEQRREESARPTWRAPPRPTQRRPIDDETAVPAAVYEQMMKLGSEARRRAVHAVAFEPPSGRPYLRRHDAPARTVPTPQAEVVNFASRPASACVSEALAEGGRLELWGSSAEPVAMQVI